MKQNQHIPYKRWKGMDLRKGILWNPAMQTLVMVGFVVVALCHPTSLWAANHSNDIVFMPIIFNGDGMDSATFPLVLIDDSGAWLMRSDGSRKVLLTHDVQLNPVADELSIQVAPTGDHIAIQRSDGWAIYDQWGHPVASGIGAGFALTWERTGTTVLLAKLGYGIDRYSLATSERMMIVDTTDETNDHSPLWSANGDLMVFAHQEFGTEFYVTLVPDYDLSQLPYIGENRDSDLFNEHFIVLEQMTSWHDQPIEFHWANDQRGLVFAAKNTIHVRSLVDDQHAMIQPNGFGERETGRAIDVNNDRILYFAGDGLYIVGLDGLNPQRLIESDDLHYPQWGPDGERVVYRGTDDQLYVADATTGGSRPIPNTQAANQFVVVPQP